MHYGQTDIRRMDRQAQEKQKLQCQRGGHCGDTGKARRLGRLSRMGESPVAFRLTKAWYGETLQASGASGAPYP